MVALGVLCKLDIGGTKMHRDCRSSAERACDIPFCMVTEVRTSFGDNSNITCAKCHMFVCGSCTQHTANTASPVQDVPAITIWTFTCPFCRAFFNEVLFH